MHVLKHYRYTTFSDEAPQCNSSGSVFSPGMSITMTCGVYFSGPWPPVMTWTFPKGVDVTHTITNVSTENYVSSVLSMVASSPLQDEVVSGVTFFDQPQPGVVTSPTFANNTIKYRYTWNAVKFVILEGTTASHNCTQTGKLHKC